MKIKRRKAVYTFFIIAICIFAMYILIDHYRNSQLLAYSRDLSSSEEIVKDDVSSTELAKEGIFAGTEVKYNNEEIPVLMYHSISNGKDNPMKLSPEQFEKQMKYLKDNGYTTLTEKQLYNFFKFNSPIPKKSVLLTFDDGYMDNYYNAYPIIKKYGFHGTIFVISNYVDKGTIYLKSKQIKEMSDYGIDIESHTVNHDRLDKLSYEQQYKTLKKSKDTLEKITGKKIESIAYPYGGCNEEALKAAKAAGYTMGFTTRGKWTSKTNGLFTLNRIYILSEQNMKDFIDRVTNSKYGLTIHPILYGKAIINYFL